jgi:plasmid stabilization system protein ParE
VKVRFSQAAERQLERIEAWLEARADAITAQRFVRGIVADALSLSQFPERGSPRPDLPRPRLRSISLRRNVTIVYRVDAQTVLIVAVRYAGQDWQGLLRER